MPSKLAIVGIIAAIVGAITLSVQHSLALSEELESIFGNALAPTDGQANYDTGESGTGRLPSGCGPVLPKTESQWESDIVRPYGLSSDIIPGLTALSSGNQSLANFLSKNPGTMYRFDDMVGFFQELQRRYDTSSGRIKKGYEFILYSAAGIHYKNPNKAAAYEEFKRNGGFAALASETKISFQMLRNGQMTRYTDGLANQISPGGEMYPIERHNTSYCSSKNAVIGYHEEKVGTPDRDSLVTVIWRKNKKSEYDPLWILRMECGNPLGGFFEKTPDCTAYGTVKPSAPKVTIPSGGSAKVRFDYYLNKKITNQSANINTEIDYLLSSIAPVTPSGTTINPAIIYNQGTVQGIALGNFLTIDQTKVKTTAPTNIQITGTKYSEEIELSEANKNKVWQQISPIKGMICRSIKATASGSNTMSAVDQKNCIGKVASNNISGSIATRACVEIDFSPSPTAVLPDGGLFVNELTPRISGISTPISEIYKGINSYAYRPKQWSKQHSEVNGSAWDYGWPAGATNAALQDMKNKCAAICRQDQENKILCDSKDYPLEVLSNTPERYCKKYCKKGGCCDTRYRVTWARANCHYLQREQGANWHITKFIVRPESSSPENIPMSSPTGINQDPCTYYRTQAGSQGVNLSGGFKCDTYRSGSFAFDDPRVYSMVSGHISPESNSSNKVTTKPFTKVFTNISPSSGGQNANVKSALNAGGDAPYTVEHLPTGSKVCFGVSMNPWINCGKDNKCPKGITKTGDWRHSAPKCFTVSKKPYFSVENGMMVTSGEIKTDLNFRDNAKAGSWSEYSALAGGKITEKFATNSATFGGTTSEASRWNYLTFANSPSNGNFSARPTRELIDPIAFFGRVATDGGNNYANTKVYRHRHDTTISSNLAPGVHYYEKDVTLTTDIRPSGQVVIVTKGNLTIHHSVKEVHAWLLVDGKLSTAEQGISSSASHQTIANNNNQLTIYGPVRARSIALRRTHGSGIKAHRLNTFDPNTDQFTSAAERFVDDAEAYIWAYYNSLQKGRIQTVYLREVAPRY